MTSQENITAGGDVAGRDIHKNQTIIVNAPKTRLGGLIDQLREQIGKDPDATEFVESLLDWINPKSTELTRDLDAKLNACGKGYLIADALEDKERFAKQLKQTTFNPAFQKIYAYILGEIHSTFNSKIKPKINAENPRGEIEGEIKKLGDNITRQIADAPPELGIGLPEVFGMLYYLTGNCHLEWEYNDSLSSSN